MDKVITNREDIFLAKIAGEDISLNTMTPPVAANMKEKLLLDIADRLDGMEEGSSGGGSGSSVFEVSGEMDMETGTLTVADITPSELFEAVSSGKIMKATIEINGQTSVAFASVNARVVNSYYEFWFMFDNGSMLKTDDLLADDAVVFQFVSD